MSLLFRNLDNKYISSNRPRPKGLVAVPHHTLLYSTRSKSQTQPEQLIKHSSYAVPMFTINHGHELKDPAMAAVLSKQDYKHKRQLLWHRLKKKRNLTEGLINEDMVKYIEMGELDPAPLISTEFDWHFSGGNLENINVEGTNFLAQTSMCDDYAIRLIKPTSDLQHIRLKTRSKRLLKNYGYEIISSKSLIGIRRKKTVNFAARDDLSSNQMNVECPIQFSWGKEIAATTLKHRNLMLVDVENNLVRIDVERLVVDSFVKLPNEFPKHQFPISISSLNQHVITYSNLKSLNVVDSRDGKVNKIFDEEDFFMRCEEISYHKKSLHEDLMYIASSHLLYGIDLRNPNDLLMHWNHQLVQQPTILKQVKCGDVEVICLSSNMPGDLKIFNCSKTGSENSWSVNWVPVKPLNANQSYYKIREKGLLLLSDPIKNRLAFSTSGVAMIGDERNSRIKLFTQNSVGDVFKSFLFCKEGAKDNEMKMIRNFQQWDEGLKIERDPLKFVPVKQRLENRELVLNNIVRLKGLSKVMRCESLQAPEDENGDSEVRSERIPRWKADLEDAKEYCDALAQHILGEWDLKLEDTQPQVFAHALKDEIYKKEKGVDKVIRWLDTASIDEACKVKLEEENATDEIQLEDYVIGQDLFTQTQTLTQQTDGSKKPNKLSTRRKGF